MIDKKRIKENLKVFSFPRLSGTDSEYKLFNIVKQKIENLNLNPSVQKFSFSTFYSRLYPKLSITLLSWLLAVIFFNINVIFNIINFLLIFVLIVFLIIITRKPERIKIGRKYHSHNLYVRLSSQTNRSNSDYTIFLLSHLDSKGQVFSIKFRIQLYYIWIISFSLGILIAVINYYYRNGVFLLLQLFSVLILSTNSISIVLLWLNRTNNKSKGAIDNATGLSCVLELLYFYSNPKNRLKNYNICFLFTGAEESGTMGIRNFYKSMKPLDREKTYISNFDSIANRVSLWNHGLLKKNKIKSLEFIRKNKELMKVEKTRRIYIGTYTDGLFLLNKGFHGLGSGDKTIYKYVHSVNDDLDKINIDLLEKLCKFYTILLDEVDNDFKKKF